MKQATMSRRTFVKSAAIAGAALTVSSALTGCFEQTTPSDDGGSKSQVEMYVSICHGCIQACPCKVYLEDGVVVKIEGHPDAPTSQGSLCMKGLNQIHTCYSPRRVLYPLKRTGARGANTAAWERISWDEAVQLAASKIAETIEMYGTYSFFCSVGGGGAYSFMQAMTTPMALGSPTVFEPGCAQCYLPRIAIAGYMYNGADQSIADCAVLEPFKGLAPLEADKGVTQDTKVLVLWAAQPSVSQTAQSGRAMAELRARGCKTIVVDPNFSPDAVKATIHLPVRPGADDALILAWYRIILDEKLYDEEFTKFYTNMPFLINPETKLPWLATDILPDYESTTPDDTPDYLCVDEDTGKLTVLPFGDPAVLKTFVNPQVLASIEVNGVLSKTAGQIYRDEAEPWTLEKAEEFCWVPKDRIRAAIDLYASAEVAGIANGVASDMEETASQVPLGLCGLDMIMGYVNKPGATLTQNGPLPADGEAPRPTRFWNGFGGMFGQMYGIGYEVGATKEANEARIAAIPEVWDPSMESAPFRTQATLYAMNQLLIDRLGMKNHKGLYEWCHSHIPTVREAIETGEPFKPRVWFDMSGNKFVVLGSAGAWYNAIMNDGVDFIICQYPMITSFQIEVADLIFPLEEWLEATGASEFGQLNYAFPSPGVIHLGETVPNSVPPKRVIDAASALLNEKLDTITFGATGKSMTEMGLQFPLGLGVMGGNDSEDAIWATQIERFGPVVGIAADATAAEYLAAAKNRDDAYIVTPPDQYWTYGQHLVTAADGLPVGFGTESRKCEVYCTLLLKMGRNGFPYCYPREQAPIDPRVGTFGGDYSPICNVPQQKEAPDVANAGSFTAGFDPEFPLAMTSGRVYYFHHGTMRHSAYARELCPVAPVRINPKTAAEYGIADGDWVEISSRRTQGEAYDHTKVTGTELSYSGTREQNTKTAEPIRTIAYVAEVVAPNVLWMERFWNPECFDSSQGTKTGGWQECNVNVITNAVDPNFNEVFGSYTNRGFQVNIKKSTKPDNIWFDPKDFTPFLPTTTNEYAPDDIGVAISNTALNTPTVVFPAPAGGGQ
ncbi:MAG: molybdopterin-dependent oxidoreductase [Coriobacteriales bacterium]|nr:molybdopterin-dependent oxidoreductase [Coriobacteriales bacterium]